MRARPARAAEVVAALLMAACGGSGGVVEVPCTFTIEADGSRKMSCPDGTSATFPSPVVSSRTGVVSGSVSLFGEPDRSGIDVWLALARETLDGSREIRHGVTDAEGAFRFADVPPGVHEVRFSSSGFSEQQREVVVDPGEFVLDPVVLRRGVDALSCQNTALFRSPRRNAFLARYGDEGLQRLVYWEPGGVGMVPLGERVDSSGSDYFSADGRLVHFIQHHDWASWVLYRYEVGDPRPRTIASDVYQWYPALGGDALVLRTGTGLKAWSERFSGANCSEAICPISSEKPERIFIGPDGRLVSFVIDDRLVVWDMRDMTGDNLGSFYDEPVFSPDGAVLVASLGDELVAWDADGARLRLGPGDTDDVSFHESGRRFLYLEVEGNSKRLVHVDLDRSNPAVTLRDSVEEAYYGPGDGPIAWIEEASEERHLYFREAPQAASVRAGSGQLFSGVTFSADGSRLYFMVDGEDGVRRLGIYEPGREPRSFAPVDDLFLDPGGDGLYFYEPICLDEVDLGCDLGLRYWDPVTGEVFRIHESVDSSYWGRYGDIYGDIKVLAGPGSRMLFADADWTWYRWDPASRTTVALGPTSGGFPNNLYDGVMMVQQDIFLTDGAVAMLDDDGLVRFLEPDGTAPRTVGTNANGFYGSSSDGLRFSYRYGHDSRARTLVLFDRALDRAIPLDDRVATAVQGDSFVAYVRNVSAADESSQRLFLVTYPVVQR